MKNLRVGLIWMFFVLYSSLAFADPVLENGYWDAENPVGGAGAGCVNYYMDDVITTDQCSALITYYSAFGNTEYQYLYIALDYSQVLPGEDGGTFRVDYNKILHWTGPGHPCQNDDGTGDEEWSNDQQACVDTGAGDDEDDKENESMGRCDCVNPCDGGSIRVSTGNNYHAEVDYSGRGVMPLKIARAYNSLKSEWTFSGTDKLIFNGDSTISWHRDDGKILKFHHKAVIGPFELELYTPGWSKIKLRDLAGAVFELTDADDNTLVFDQDGVLLQRSNKNGGVHHTYDYNDEDQLRSISRSLGGELVYEWSGSNVVKITVVGSLGQEAHTYSYVGDKVREHLLGGNVLNSYSYEGGYLSGAKDAYGYEYATWVYEGQGRVRSVSHSKKGGETNFQYVSDNTTRVRNVFDKTTSYSFTDEVGVYRVTNVVGDPTERCDETTDEYTYYPEDHINAGLVKTKASTEGVVTSYEYNDRGLVVLKVEGKDTDAEQVTETVWHDTLSRPVSITRGNRVVTYAYDSAGNVTSQKISGGQ
ncbi:DUF6531 domain-containing protein [Gilvimarinus sp. SDUM040013]|nr:DUF6531 domain-containing protein [Gilvimarinus sp. SDUM040013]MDO3388133.1 DUF6531 domain-containing protein [Gilvimarinus sp. SDUM040013]